MASLRRRARRIFGQQDAGGGYIVVRLWAFPGGSKRPGRCPLRLTTVPPAGGLPRAAAASRPGPVRHHHRAGGASPGSDAPRWRSRRGAVPGAHHGNCRLLVQGGHAALDVQHQGRIENVSQALGILRVLEGQDALVQASGTRQNAVRYGEVRVQRSFAWAGGTSSARSSSSRSAKKISSGEPKCRRSASRAGPFAPAAPPATPSISACPAPPFSSLLYQGFSILY